MPEDALDQLSSKELHDLAIKRAKRHLDVKFLYRLMQVLRLTIALEKADARIVAAAEDAAGSCRRAAASLAASRADYPSRQTVALVSDLGEKLRAAFTELP